MTYHQAQSLEPAQTIQSCRLLRPLRTDHDSSQSRTLEIATGADELFRLHSQFAGVMLRSLETGNARLFWLISRDVCAGCWWNGRSRVRSLCSSKIVAVASSSKSKPVSAHDQTHSTYRALAFGGRAISIAFCADDFAGRASDRGRSGTTLCTAGDKQYACAVLPANIQPTPSQQQRARHQGISRDRC